MNRWLRYLFLVIVLRLIIGLFLLVIPIDRWTGLDIDPLWTAIRILLFVWLVRKVLLGSSGDFGKTVWVSLIVLAVVGDWYWNASTYCSEHDTSTEGNVTSIVTDFIPFVGDLKGLSEFVDGCDTVTGEKLGSFRWFGLFGIIGLAEVGVVGDVAKFGLNGVEAGIKSIDNLAIAGLRNTDEVVRAIARSGRELGEAVTRNGGKILDEVSIGAARGADNFNAAGAAIDTFGCSFSAATLVETERGARPISEIQVGDSVLAYDEDTDHTGYYIVTATLVDLDSLVVLLLLDGELVETTPEHPFYITARETRYSENILSDYWIPAGDIKVGDHIRRADGSTGVVELVTMTWHSQPMYNLTVAEANTYFVSELQLLVHNSCIKYDTRQLQSKFSNHARAFGITDNWSQEASAKFIAALDAHVGDPSTQLILGTHRTVDKVKFYFNPTTNLMIMTDMEDNFISGWKLGQEQIESLLRNGNIQ